MVLRSHSSLDHFDALTLSIYESADQMDVDKVHDFSIHRKYSDAGTIGQIGSDTTAFAALTNRHEHDHFRLHTSSQLGLLQTLMLSIRQRQLVNYLYSPADHRELRRTILSRLNLALDSLYGFVPGMTQQDAVDVWNQFFKLYFGVEDVLTTSNPTAPACKHPALTYQCIMEARAVGGEMAQLAMLDLTPEQRDMMLRVPYRNKEIYFDLIESLVAATKSITSARMLCSYAMDATVPFFFSPGRQGVDWEAFSPGYRLFSLAANFTHNIVQTEVHTSGWIEKDERVGYLVNYAAQCFTYLESIAQQLFDTKTLHMRGIEGRKVELVGMLDHLTPAFAPYFKDGIFDSHGQVLAHASWAHNFHMEHCARAPVNYYGSQFVADAEGNLRWSDFPPVPDHLFDEKLALNRDPTTCAVIYTVRSGRYDTIYITQATKLLQAIKVKIESFVLEARMNSLSREEARQLIMNYSTFADNVIDPGYFALVDNVLTDLYENQDYQGL